MPSFVKFSRGLSSIYNNLQTKDPDTLYLVYDSVNSGTGSLYLGNKLISSVSGGGSATALADLSDVSLEGTLEDGMLLQYNESTGGGQWEAVPLSDIIPSGIGNDISFVEALNEISLPNETDIAIIGNDAYVYDGEDWVQLSNSSLASRIAALETSVGHPADVSEGIAASGLYADIASLQTSLSNVYTKAETNSYVASQIAAVQHLKYEIVASIASIDTTKENTIFLVPKSETGTNNGYDEYFVINGDLEKIGSWDVDLSNYVQTNDSRLLTDAQKTKLDAITLDSNDNLTITASQVSDLSTAITNGQYIKSVEVGSFNVTNAGELQLIGIPSSLLSGYVTTTTFNNTVGDLTQLNNRVANDSTLVDEINVIKESIIWNTLTNE